ncbi:MAG: hypothetical protein U1F29_12075 [Planctomycetota bacterium]
MRLLEARYSLSERVYHHHATVSALLANVQEAARQEFADAVEV